MAKTALVGSLLSTAIVIFTTSLSLPATQTPAAVKLIEYGWDSPSPDFVRANVAAMERRPFDGVAIHLPDDGGQILDPGTWDAATLEKQLPVLQEIAWHGFDSNFIATFATSPIDWYDDDAWAKVRAHAAFAARAARACRCRGVTFDAEPYGDNPWTYPAQPRASDHSFADYEALVRRRGRDLVAAMQRELPGIEIFILDGYSYFLRLNARAGATRESILVRQGWGLLPAFLDGLLDGADPDTRLVDGHERSYYYETPEDFARGAVDVRDSALAFVAPDLRDKYRRQVGVAQPLFLDWLFGLFTPAKATIADGLTAAQRTRLAEHHAYYAMKNVDRYVWIYGEHVNWWKDDVPAGADEALRSARKKVASGEPLGFDVGGLRPR